MLNLKMLQLWRKFGSCFDQVNHNTRYALIGGHLFISLSGCDLYYILYQNSDIKTLYIMVLVQQH